MWSVWLVFCNCGFHSVCPLMDQDKRLMEDFWWERLIVGETRLVLMAGACSVNLESDFCWWAGLCSLSLFDLSPNYCGGNEDNGGLLQSVPCTHCHTQCPGLSSRPLLAHAYAGDSWTPTGSLGQSLVGSLLLSSGFCCTQGFVCALQESVSPILCKFCDQILLASNV